ncbi:MAG: hypothetical protein JXR73_01090 [Candidatus Omnitrophica bacterium]|nr:hypothetical protein [Candidatus Omnitrophota bacterium]
MNRKTLNSILLLLPFFAAFTYQAIAEMTFHDKFDCEMVYPIPDSNGGKIHVSGTHYINGISSQSNKKDRISIILYSKFIGKGVGVDSKGNETGDEYNVVDFSRIKFESVGEDFEHTTLMDLHFISKKSAKNYRQKYQVRIQKSGDQIELIEFTSDKEK